MTRFGIDALTALRLAEDRVVVAPEHRLVAPNLLRSHAMSHLYRSVRRGERTDKEGLALLERLAGLKIRLLGDRVSRSTAWKIAARLDWPDVGMAEYLAVAKLQADKFVTLDPELAAVAAEFVPTAAITELSG
jgi:predicted nucleic acid-binding protein